MYSTVVLGIKRREKPLNVRPKMSRVQAVGNNFPTPRRAVRHAASSEGRDRKGTPCVPKASPRLLDVHVRKKWVRRFDGAHCVRGKAVLEMVEVRVGCGCGVYLGPFACALAGCPFFLGAKFEHLGLVRICVVVGT
jgi:hypothetical protein